MAALLKRSRERRTPIDLNLVEHQYYRWDDRIRANCSIASGVSYILAKLRWLSLLV
ncbi:MAG: hypothetical protein QNJ54_23500 [Prochloraceae cyanobacterium]|nr:hypothetical protein [Prochloraceae cyanobacterium]